MISKSELQHSTWETKAKTAVTKNLSTWTKGHMHTKLLSIWKVQVIIARNDKQTGYQVQEKNAQHVRNVQIKNPIAKRNQMPNHQESDIGHLITQRKDLCLCIGKQISCWWKSIWKLNSYKWHVWKNMLSTIIKLICICFPWCWGAYLIPTDCTEHHADMSDDGQ